MHRMGQLLMHSLLPECCELILIMKNNSQLMLIVQTVVMSSIMAQYKQKSGTVIWYAVEMPKSSVVGRTGSIMVHYTGVVAFSNHEEFCPDSISIPLSLRLLPNGFL